MDVVKLELSHHHFANTVITKTLVYLVHIITYIDFSVQNSEHQRVLYHIFCSTKTTNTENEITKAFFFAVCPFGFGVVRFILKNILENVYELDEGFCYNGIYETVIFGMT